MVKRAFTIFLLVFLVCLAGWINVNQTYEWWQEYAKDSAIVAIFLTPFLYLLFYVRKYKIVVRTIILVILLYPFAIFSAMVLTNTRLLMAMATSEFEPWSILEFNVVPPQFATYFLMNFPSLHSPEGGFKSIPLFTENDIPLVIWSQRGISENSDPQAKDRAYKILRWLIDNGESVNEKAPGGYTAIHESILFRNPVYMNIVIEAGADLEQTIDSPRSKVHGLDAIGFLDRLDHQGSKEEYRELRIILEKAYFDQGIECGKCILESHR